MARMCYVGKATKIFIFLVAILAATGLILGFGLFRRGWAHKARGCSDDAGGCRPATPVPADPIPAATTGPSTPAAEAAATTGAIPAVSVASPPLSLTQPGPSDDALVPAHG